VEDEQQGREDQQREDDDPEPAVSDGKSKEIDRAGHPGGGDYHLVGGAENRADCLLEDEGKTPGGEEGFEGAAIEPADDAALDADPDGAGDEEGGGQGDEKGIVEQKREVSADDQLDEEGGVGPEHDHFAVGHVDDAHDAEGDGETDGGEEENRA